MTGLSPPEQLCGAPMCGLPLHDATRPDFAFRMALVVAIASHGCIEAVDGGGQTVCLEAPDGSWHPDDHGVYWEVDGPVLPAGTPLCAAHRCIWDEDHGVLVVRRCAAFTGQGGRTRWVFPAPPGPRALRIRAPSLSESDFPGFSARPR